MLVLRAATIPHEDAVAAVEAAQPRLGLDAKRGWRLAVGLYVLVADAQAQPLRLFRVWLALELIEELLELQDAPAVGVERVEDASDIRLS